MREGAGYSEHGQGSFGKEEMAAFRNKVKIMGGEAMIVGVTEDEATAIEQYANEIGVPVERKTLYEQEIQQHAGGDAGKKFGISLGHTVDSEKKLFGE